MAKRKGSEALFEIIAKTKDSQDSSAITVPEWMSKKPAEQREPEAGPEPREEPEAAQAPPQAPLKGGRAEPRRPEVPRPLLGIRDGQVIVSLNFFSCVVLGLALATLVVSMFVLGWKWGARSAAGTTVAAPYRPDVLGKKDPSRTTTKPPVPKRVDGKYYMLIQALGGTAAKHWAEAKMIVDFCNKADLPADIGRMRNPSQYVVWSLTGFDSPDSREAQRCAQRIEALGQRYKTEHGTYEFKQTDPVGNWPWFHQYRPRG